MTLSESFALLSSADLRYHPVPDIRLFFAGTILLILPTTPTQTGRVVLGCAWGVLLGLPDLLSVPLLFDPPAWPVLLTGCGHRRGLID